MHSCRTDYTSSLSLSTPVEIDRKKWHKWITTLLPWMYARFKLNKYIINIFRSSKFHIYPLSSIHWNFKIASKGRMYIDCTVVIKGRGKETKWLIFRTRSCSTSLCYFSPYLKFLNILTCVIYCFCCSSMLKMAVGF